MARSRKAKTPAAVIANDSSYHKLVRVLALAVVAIGIAQYAQTITYDFAYDDYPAIVENDLTQRGLQAIPSILSTDYYFGTAKQTRGLYRPLPKSVFALFWSFSPNNAVPLHVLNVVLYALTGLVTFTVLRRFMSDPYAPFVATALFMAHPIHTEVVANIKSLDEILSFFSFMASLLFMQKFLQSNRKRWLAMMFLSYFLSLASKESAITFIAVYPLALFVFSNLPARKILRISIWPLIAAALFLGIRYSIVDSASVPTMSDNALLATTDVLSQKTTAIYILAVYVKLLFFPHPLSFDYSFKQIPLTTLSDWRFWVSFAVLGVLLLFALRRLRRKDVAAFGVLFCFLTISVSSNLFVTIGTHMGERLLYTASFGFCLAVASLLERIVSNRRPSAGSFRELLAGRPLPTAAVLLILALFSVKTWSQNPVWRNNETLFRSGVIRAPESYRTHWLLGSHLIKPEYYSRFPKEEQRAIGEYGLAELRRSLSIYPNFYDSWVQIGNHYANMGDYVTAVDSYQKAIGIETRFAISHHNLGAVYGRMGRWGEAVAEFQQAVKYAPGFHLYHLNLGLAYGWLGKPLEATSSFQRALTLSPQNAQAAYFLGLAYRGLNDHANASYYLNKAAAIDPKYRNY